MRTRLSANGREGLTLVELLVVVTVIAILIAILLPAMSRIKKRGRTVVCITNERGLVTFLQEYMDRQHKMVDPASHPGPFGCWDYQLLGGTTTTDDYYAKNGLIDSNAKFRWCPEAPYAKPTPKFGTMLTPYAGTASSQWYCEGKSPGVSVVHGSSGSYGLNAWLYPGSGTGASAQAAFPFRPWQMQDVVPVFVDSVAHDLKADPANLPTTVMNPGGSVFMGSLNSACLDRHEKAVNVAFIDRHVETVKLPDLWTLKWSRTWNRSTPQKVPSK